jgi:dTDP-glucose 4,6-dehydratase
MRDNGASHSTFCGSNKMAHYLVTGAGGFLGRHMALRLAKAGHHVYCPFRRNEPPDHPNILKFKGLIEEPEIWWSNIPEQLDAVMHFAALLPADNSTAAYIRINSLGTAKLLDICKRYGSPRFLLASTLYLAGTGYPNGIPDDAPLVNHHPYYISKYTAERLCLAYGEESGAGCVNLRISSPYGPGMSDKMVIRIFMEQALKERCIRIFGSGEKIQNFIYYEELLDIFTLSLTRGNGTYNACAKYGTSIRELSETIAIIANNNTRIVHIDSNVDDKELHWIPATEKIANEIGYIQKYDLVAGCRKTYQYIRAGYE